MILSRIILKAVHRMRHYTVFYLTKPLIFHKFHGSSLKRLIFTFSTQHFYKVSKSLKYQFWKNVTSEKWNSDKLNTFGYICLRFWAWLLLYSAITPKSEDKYVQKCSTSQSFIFPKWHSYKIGTLTTSLYHAKLW